MPLAAGTRIGTYEILAPLGSGGMGEVYRAKDLRLGRDIALKLLPPGMSTDADRLARFEREARTLAGLNHPSIVMLHSVEDDGAVHFLTMELVDGRTLDRALVPGGLAVERVMDIGIALADALAAAHEKGVVHRDFKPANVMLTTDGRVKVLDFGLAKPAAADADPALSALATLAAPRSGEGMLVGTVPYMAPEQIRGERVDARTDLFALGIVLYELASGRRPFAGDSLADVSSAILRDAPPPLAAVRGGVPDDLARVIARCLAKRSHERPQSALEVAAELRRAREALARGDAPSTATPAPPEATSIAVLPFVNRSASVDDEYFSDGLADELLNVLAKIKALRVIARASSFRFRGRDVPLAEIGRTLNVATVLDGSVRRAGGRVRINVQLVRVEDRSHLWSESYDRTLDDIFAVQDDIARSVVTALSATLLGHPAPATSSGSLAAAPPRASGGRIADPEVYDLYLRGRHQLSRRGDESLRRAIEFFASAIVRDPGFALADLGLAEAHGLIGFHEFQPPREAFVRARAAAERVLLADARLGEAHAVLGYVALHHDRAWAAAEREFLRAIELSPGHAITRLWYANVLLASGRFDQALDQGRRAIELDPLSIFHSVVTGWIHFFERRFDVAYEQLARAIELDPGFFQAHQWRGWALWQMGRSAEAAIQLDAAAKLAQHPPTVLANQAMAAALAGRAAEHRDALARLIAMRDERYVSAYLIALAHLVAGEPDGAEPWIERAAEERSPWVGFMKVDPRVDALRGRPRIEALVAGLGRGT